MHAHIFQNIAYYFDLANGASFMVQPSGQEKYEHSFEFVSKFYFNAQHAEKKISANDILKYYSYFPCK